MKTCIEITAGLDTPVKLEQRGIDSFRVTYGLQVKDRLTYAEAASELGACIMHSVACLGALDNREPGEG